MDQGNCFPFADLRTCCQAIRNSAPRFPTTLLVVLPAPRAADHSLDLPEEPLQSVGGRRNPSVVKADEQMLRIPSKEFDQMVHKFGRR